MKILKVMLYFILFKLIGCDANKLNGKFHEEASFKDYTKNYPYTIDEARKLLRVYVEKEKVYYRPFPREIVYAYESGYLFMKGEFKLNLQLNGYYVDKKGNVSPLNLKKAIGATQYNKRKNYRIE